MFYKILFMHSIMHLCTIANPQNTKTQSRENVRGKNVQKQNRISTIKVHVLNVL